jgi:hypothetical protein
LRSCKEHGGWQPTVGTAITIAVSFLVMPIMCPGRKVKAEHMPACDQGERPSGAPSSQRRAAWMVENVRSRRPGRSRALTLLTNASFPVEPVKMAMGPGVPWPLSDLA